VPIQPPKVMPAKISKPRRVQKVSISSGRAAQIACKVGSHGDIRMFVEEFCVDPDCAIGWADIWKSLSHLTRLQVVVELLNINKGVMDR